MAYYHISGKTQLCVSGKIQSPPGWEYKPYAPPRRTAKILSPINRTFASYSIQLTNHSIQLTSHSIQAQVTL